MLNVIVFVCGAALMALELAAARILAPYLGNSIFVWGSVISVVMVALSSGYWLGGHLADREHADRMLAPVIAGSGVLTVIAPLMADAVLPWAASLGPRLGSLSASALIFFAPAILLAMVSPLGVRFAARRGLERIGRSAGGLYAVSTAGSIVGTVATSFWLIPALSLEPLIVAIGFSLFAAAFAALALREPSGVEAERLASRRTRVRRTTAAATIALATVGVLLGGWIVARVAPAAAVNESGERVLYRRDTQYHRITVTEADGVRHLRFDASNQSAIDLSDGYTSAIAYPNYMDIALALNPDARRVLVLGLGGGAITKRWWRDYPALSIDSVEIDEAVIDVSKRFFGLPDDERLRIFNQDARRFVQTSLDTYDVVIVDAYYADSLPFHLTTDEFFGEVKARMSPDGVLAYNVIGSVTGDDSRLFRSMYYTVRGHWEDLWVFPIGLRGTGETAKRRNIIVLATDAPMTRGELVDRIVNRVDGRVRIDGFPDFARDLYTGVVPLGDVPKLTDAYAPTDSLIEVQ